MTGLSSRVRGALLGLVPTAVAAALAALALGRGIPASRLGWALGAAAAGGAIAGAIVLGPLLARLRSWPSRLREATRRLEELEADQASAVDDPSMLETGLDLGPVSDPAFDDALGELASALRDEERIRDLREGRAETIRTLLRRGRELSANGELLPGSTLTGLLQDLERDFRAVREQADVLLQQAIANDEISSLLHEHATSGREALKRAGLASEALNGHIESVAKLVHRLEARSREIEQVLLVLNDITEQTNLLALNAAIIAAQAGEQGKGFGVVAEEMRNLSERAASSTKETEFLSQTLRDDVGQVLRSMVRAGESVSDVRSSVVEAGEAGTTLLELGRRIQGVAREGIASTEKQASVIREITSRRPALEAERARISRVEADVFAPAMETLGEAVEQLDSQWQLGAVRDTLRTRLTTAVRILRERVARESVERAQLDESLRLLRQSGRQWQDALAAGRRREHLVLEVTRDIRELTGAADR